MVDDADEGTLVGLDEWNEWRLTEEARIPGRDTPSSESLDELPVRIVSLAILLTAVCGFVIDYLDSLSCHLA